MLLLNLDLLATSPGGVARLRELILTLAVQGKLVPQDPSDEPASVLLQRIRAEKDRLIAEGKIKRDKPLAQVAEDEMPFELPEGWEWTRLADVVRVLNGRAYAKQELLDKGTPVLRVGNLFTSNHWYYSDLQLEAEKYCSHGDLLYAWSASFGPFIWNGPRAIYHYHIWKLEPYARDAFDTSFFHTYLLEKTAEIKAAGHGVSMVHMTKEKMEKIVVPYPPLAEQSRIVARFEELMRLCDALEAKGRLEAAQHAQLVSTLLATLTDSATPEALTEHWQRLATHFDTLLDRPEAVDALEQTILQLAVRGLLVPQDPTDEPARELLKKIRQEKDRLIAAGQIKRDKPLPPITDDEKPFELPVGWEWSRLADIAVRGPTNGLSPRPTETPTDVRCLSLSATTQGFFRPECFKYVDVPAGQAEQFWLKRGDLLIQRGNSLDYVGIAALYDGPDDSYIYPDLMMRLQLSHSVSASYVHMAMICVEGRDYFKRSATGTQGTMPKVNQATVAGAPLPLPPLAEQSRIVACVAALRRLCADLRQRLSASQTAQALLAGALVENVP